MLAPQPPPSPPCVAPQASQVLPPPLPAFIGMQVKISFFLLFFHFISDQCYRDPLYPTCQVFKPLSLHHIIPTPVPHPSSLTIPCHCLCFTPHKPVAASIFATCKSTTTATLSLCARPTHNTNSPHASPAIMLSQHGMQGHHNANPRCTSPAMAPPQYRTQDPKTANPPCTGPTMVPPQHGMQGPTTTNLLQHVGPCHHAISNMVHKTVAMTNDHNNGENNGAVVVNSGMVAAGMAVTARHSYYLRLYIFYLCNKWILFLYFV